MDRSEFDRRLEAEMGSLRAFAISIVRNRHLADDLVQDALVRAAERLDSLRDADSLGPWLRRILHNLAIDRGRRSVKEVLVEEVEENWRNDAYTVDPAAVVERAQDRRELEDALVRLPLHYRTAVILHDAEDWTVREIAELEGIGVPAAKQRLRRGRMMLVSALAAGVERRHALEGVPMKCWDARRHVSDYLDRRLDDETAAVVEAHLGTCPTCPPLYAALVGVKDALGNMRDPDSVIEPQVASRISPG